MVSACSSPQVFKVHKVLGNNKRRKVRVRGCCSLGAIKLEDKQERKFFTENFSLQKIELLFKKVLTGKVPKHFCPSFCSWVSLLESFKCLLLSLNGSRLFLAEEGFHKSDPSCPYFLVYFCISCLPWEPGLSTDKQLLTAIIHGLLWCICKVTALSAFETLAGSFSAVTCGRISRKLHKDVNIPGFLFQPSFVWHRQCPAQQGSVCHRQRFSHTTATWPFPSYLQYWAVASLPWTRVLGTAGLPGQWLTEGSTSRRDATVALQPEKSYSEGLSCWPGPSVRGALPGGQT